MEILFISIFIVALLLAGISDLSTYKISNKLTLPLFVIGIIYQVLFGSFISLILGFGVGFIVGFICWLSGGMGGGDVKLMAAIGTWLGFESFLLITFIACIFGLIWAMFDFIKQGRLKEKLIHIFSQLKMFKFLGFKALDVKNSDMKKPIPFGSCLSLATMIVIFAL